MPSTSGAQTKKWAQRAVAPFPGCQAVVPLPFETLQPRTKGELSEGEVKKKQEGNWKWPDTGMRSFREKKENQAWKWSPGQSHRAQAEGQSGSHLRRREGGRVRIQISRPGGRSEAGQLYA